VATRGKAGGLLHHLWGEREVYDPLHNSSPKKTVAEPRKKQNRSQKKLTKDKSPKAEFGDCVNGLAALVSTLSVKRKWRQTDKNSTLGTRNANMHERKRLPSSGAGWKQWRQWPLGGEKTLFQRSQTRIDLIRPAFFMEGHYTH